MMKNKTAVITGATGMLGLALIRCLTGHGWNIYAVVRPGSKRIGNIPVQENVTVTECDLSRIHCLPELIDEKCDAFFHFGWDGTYGDNRNNMELQLKNVSAAVSAAEAAHALGCEFFAGAGSQAEYGRKQEKLSPETSADPETGYGIAKLCAGQMTRAVCRKNGVRHVWNRIFSTYGPYDAAHTMVMSGIIKMSRGEHASYTKGEQLWDYLYCDDAAEAFRLTAEKGRDGAVYCIGSGMTRKLSEYILDIRDAVNPALEAGIGELPYYENQVMYLCADIASLQRDTGFSPSVSFADGIRRTVDWYLNLGAL